MKRLLTILRADIAKSCRNGMCYSILLVHGLDSEDRASLRWYLGENKPEHYAKYVAAVQIAYDSDELKGFSQYSAHIKAHEIGKAKTGHHYNVYWWAKGDQKSRLDWLDKQIKNLKDEE